jgi:hypothetical protein
MSIIHVQQIQAQLKSLFDGLIDLTDCASRPDSEKESFFLTRALAAFSLTHLADITPKQAARCVTDGGQDNGLDAILYDSAEQTLYLVQSKWKHKGKGSIERGEAQKFLVGVNDLINNRFDRFNAKIQNRASEIKQAIYSAQTRFALVVAYTGQEPLSDDVQRDFDDFLSEMNDPTDIVQLRILRQGNIHSIIASGTLGAPIDLEVGLQDWGQIREPYQAYYGRVSATEVAAWWSAHYPRIFAPNLRMFLGFTEVNQSILDTLHSDPEHFWYFNNGVTALCASIKKKPIGGSSRDGGVFECSDVRIVNGAQTVGALATAYARDPQSLKDVTVTVRFISLEQCPDGFSTQVTRATNTQNRIERRDFVSLDPEQERLRTELQLDGIDYVFKSGDSPRDQARGFDIVEATVALACSHADVSHAVQAKREIGRLWEDIHKPPYRLLFNSSVSSRRLWLLVQILRVIDEELQVLRDSKDGRKGMFPVHGNRFIAHWVYKQLSLDGLDEPDADVSEVIELAKQITGAATERLIKTADDLYPDSYLASLFKNANKCRQLDEQMGIIWKEDFQKSVEQWISTEEAVGVTGFSAQRVRRLAREGRVLATKKGGRWWLDRKNFMEFVSAQAPQDESASDFKAAEQLSMFE